MTTIPAYTIGGLTRPELHLDPSGNIILDPAAQAFVNTYGLQYLYLGCPPGTPWPPVPGFLSPPTDANAGANTVVEGAAANTSVGITAQSTSLIGLPVTYSLASDSSHGGFKVDPNTGVVSIADPSKVDFESSGGSYVVNVQATDGIFVSSQSFTIAVSNAPPSTPTDGNATANAVNEGAAVNTSVGITASSADVNGPGVTYSLTSDSSNGGFKIDPTTGIVTVANSAKIDFETAPGHAYTITVQASDGHGGVSSQSFTINVNDVAVSTPVDINAAANSVVEGAAVNTLVGNHRLRGRSERPRNHLFADRRHLRRRLHHQCHDGCRHRRRSEQARLRERAGPRLHHHGAGDEWRDHDDANLHDRRDRRPAVGSHRL
ncbi:hypothetical protein ACVIWU_000154 [Bradyrhizobium sp. USDA 4509]